MSTQKLIIVGNAPVEEDYSRQIDDADCVIRFNKCQSFETGNTGQRTDILCLAGGQCLEEFIRPDGLVRSIVESTKEIWFKKKLPACEEVISVHNLQEKTIRYVDVETIDELRRVKLASIDNPPSFGITAIELVLTEKRFENFEKFIVGFTWRGSPVHNWEAEKQLCSQYLAEKRIEQLL